MQYPTQYPTDPSSITMEELLARYRTPFKLTFVEVEDGYSIYVDRDGYEVYLAHGTGHRLVHLDDLDIHALYGHYRMTHGAWGQGKFLDALRDILIDEGELETVRFCVNCSTVICEDLLEDVHWVGDGTEVACDRCFDYYGVCCSCERWEPNLTTAMGDEAFCDECLSEKCSWCDYCEGYFFSENADEHYHHDGCGCESPAGLSFEIRNNGELLANDTLVTVALPAGVISDEGMWEISNAIRSYGYSMPYATDEERQQRDATWNVAGQVSDLVGERWQTKEGNFTKRLSRMAYKKYGLKLPPALISQVGNIARNHSTAINFEIEVTRNLNLSAAEFYHDDSCWWQSYEESRCALKSNGGFGLRTFGTAWRGEVCGRAWVMPMKDLVPTGLAPTFETRNPDAFVVFNGYGDLEGYTPARIISHMTGMTYRKINFQCSPMYVNNASGYLVAPEEIAAAYANGGLSLWVDPHSGLFAKEAASRAAADDNDTTTERILTNA